MEANFPKMAYLGYRGHITQFGCYEHCIGWTKPSATEIELGLLVSEPAERFELWVLLLDLQENGSRFGVELVAEHRNRRHRGIDSQGPC